MSGAIFTQGPHHGAQKSIMTGRLPWISLSKVASVTVNGPRNADSSGVWHFPQATFFPLAAVGMRFAWPQLLQRTTGPAAISERARRQALMAKHRR